MKIRKCSTKPILAETAGSMLHIRILTNCPACRKKQGHGALRAKKQASFAEIGFLLAQFHERKSRAPFAEIAFLLAQFRERKSLQLLLKLLGVLIARPCKGADRRPARSGPPSRSREAKPNWRERNRCSGADRRPARSGPPSRSREAKPNWRERNRCSGADRRPARSGPPLWHFVRIWPNS